MCGRSEYGASVPQHLLGTLTQAQELLLEWMNDLPKGNLEKKTNTLDFIVIGPITEESKLVSGKFFHPLSIFLVLRINNRVIFCSQSVAQRPQFREKYHRQSYFVGHSATQNQ